MSASVVIQLFQDCSIYCLQCFWSNSLKVTFTICVSSNILWHLSSPDIIFHFSQKRQNDRLDRKHKVFSWQQKRGLKLLHVHPWIEFENRNSLQFSALSRLLKNKRCFTVLWPVFQVRSVKTWDLCILKRHGLSTIAKYTIYLGPELVVTQESFPK